MENEYDIDKATADDMDAIAKMIELANEHGLLTEVIYSLCHALVSMPDIPQETADALNAWDI